MARKKRQAANKTVTKKPIVRRTGQGRADDLSEAEFKVLYFMRLQMDGHRLALNLNDIKHTEDLKGLLEQIRTELASLAPDPRRGDILSPPTSPMGTVNKAKGKGKVKAKAKT